MISLPARSIRTLPFLWAVIIRCLVCILIQVNSAFNGKRKMLRRSLQHICTPMEIENALGNVGRPATVLIAISLLTNYVGKGLHKLLPLEIQSTNFFVLIVLLQSRPEELSMDDFVKLHNLIVKV